MPSDSFYISRTELFDKITEHANLNKRLCFIFGAGASYGYSNTSGIFRPPVVVQLFDITNPLVTSVINRAKHDYISLKREYIENVLKYHNNDLEQYLSTLYHRDDENELFISLLHYLHDIYSAASLEIDRQNNCYIQLVHRITDMYPRTNWASISFNYDTIFEQSLRLVGPDRSRQLNSLKSYVNEHPRVIKVHGGINFYFKFKEQDKSMKSEKEIFNMMMSGLDSALYSVSFVDQSTPKPSFVTTKKIWKTQFESSEAYEYQLPMMMVPLHGIIDVNNSYFGIMMSKAIEEIGNSDLVIAIGYNFGDEIFRKMLSRVDTSTKEIILVGNKSSLVNSPFEHPSYRNISQVWVKDRIKVFNGDGFSEFAEAITNKE